MPQKICGLKSLLHLPTRSDTHYQPLRPSHRGTSCLSNQPLEGAICSYRGAHLPALSSRWRDDFSSIFLFYLNDKPVLFGYSDSQYRRDFMPDWYFHHILGHYFFSPPETGKRHTCFCQHPPSGHTLICQHPSESKGSKLGTPLTCPSSTSSLPITHPPIHHPITHPSTLSIFPSFFLFFHYKRLECQPYAGHQALCWIGRFGSCPGSRQRKHRR